MTRADLLQKWATIQRWQASEHPPDWIRASGLLEELAHTLAGKALVLDDGRALYEYDGTLIVTEVFNDPV